MATYIAKQLLYHDRLVQPGEEYELDLPEGVNPPPAEVAVPKSKRGRKSADDVTPEE